MEPAPPTPGLEQRQLRQLIDELQADLRRAQHLTAGDRRALLDRAERLLLAEGCRTGWTNREGKRKD
jgi:hypothetical protein